MLNRELFALSSAVISLAAAVAVLFLIHWYADRRDSVALIAILVIPLVVYVLLSGRLQELTGPGGWGAKFQSLAHSSVDSGGILGDAEPLQYVSKGAVKDLKSLVAALDPHLPRALILQVGKRGTYDAGAIASYLKALMAAGAPTYVIFIDTDNRKFVGSASGTQIFTLLTDEQSAQAFMIELEQGGLQLLTQNGLLVTDFLTPKDTHAAALQKFLDTNTSALVIVSESQARPIGVVDRDCLVLKLLLKLAS